MVISIIRLRPKKKKICEAINFLVTFALNLKTKFWNYVDFDEQTRTADSFTHQLDCLSFDNDRDQTMLT